MRGGLVLTAVSLMLRGAGIAFAAWLTRRIGEEGMGLFQLVSSVYSLAATFAVSGVSVAMTRVLSERADHRRVLRAGLGISAAMSVCATALLLFLAEWIGERWLGDARTVAPLRLYSFSLVSVAVGGCVGGFYLSQGMIARASRNQIFEQAVRMAASVALLSLVRPGDVESACAAIVLGSAAAELASACYGLLACRARLRRTQREQPPAPAGQTRPAAAIARIAGPVAASAYVRSGLRTAENVLLPRGLEGFGMTRAAALGEYGVLRSIAMPVIWWPGTAVSAFSSLLIPVLARWRAQGRQARIRWAARRAMLCALGFGAACAAAIAICAPQISALIYGGEELARLLRTLAILAPVTYLDTVTDSILSALDQQVAALRINTADSVLRVALLLWAVPRWGMAGYVGVMLLSAAFNMSLSVRRLAKTLRG